MAIRIISLALVFAYLSFSVAAQTRDPVVEDFSPQIVSVNSILELQGYRLHSSSAENTTVYFLQNGNTYVAQSKRGSSVTNDAQNGRQTLEVVVPEEVASGPTRVFVEINSLRSLPVTVTMADRKLPEVKGVAPTRGSPDTYVFIDCFGFHIDDEIELTDAAGTVTKLTSGGSNRIGFRVPKDAAEGPMLIRIGNHKYSNQFTEPVNFLVTNDPLPLEIVPGWMKSVAPGQCLDIQVQSNGPLKVSELTEVAFKQAGRSIVVATPNPRRPHVIIPTVLSPGDLQLQTRTWRNGNPSVWSTETPFRLTEQPVPPSFGAIRLEHGRWVHLWPGPDRPSSFSATAGDVIVLNGSFRSVDASKLKVLLVGSAGSLELDASELDPKAEWFGEIVVKLPVTLGRGNWRMLVANSEDATQAELPIVIKIR